jgi:uncharacterized repeat protein (TIGR01451 family)
MRRSTVTRRVRRTCLAAITGLGVPLLVTVGAGNNPAVGATQHSFHLARDRQVVQNAERRMERKGYLQARARYYDARRLSGNRAISVERASHLRAHAANQRQSLRQAPVARRPGRPALSSAPTVWQALPEKTTLQIGRTTSQLQTVSGRISALAVDTQGHIFAGAAQGGVWRYDPATGRWTALTDNLSTLAVGALAIAPSNNKVIYLGSGEGDLSGDSYFGDGVYRSADGGNSWQHVNGGSIFTGTSISKIVVDPTNPNRLYVATIRGKAGSFRVSSPFQQTWGVYRSVDGGKHWTALRTTNQFEHGAADLALDPNDPHTVYSTFVGKGIFRTTSASHQKKWKRIMTGLPANADYVSGPTRFAISATKLPKHRTRLYAGFDYTDTSGTYHPSRIFRSDNGGNSWRKLPTEGPLPQVDSVLNYCDIQCTYDNVVTADPKHYNVVYVAGEYNYPLGSGGIYRSTDGGRTWLNLGLDLHPDFHAIALQPGKYSHVVIGNDGGVWDSANRGGRQAPGASLDDAQWRNLNDGLQITQIDSVDYSNNFFLGPVLYAGTQDNGTQVGPLPGAVIGDSHDNVWLDVGGGDGGVAFVDPNNPDLVFGSFYGISPYRWDDGATSFSGQSLITNGINLKDRSEFYTPWVQNQLHSNQLVLGTYRVYRTDNAEATKASDVTWKPISTDLTTGCKGPAPNTGRGCLISAVGVSDGGAGVYAGTEEGLVWSSADGLTADSPTWTRTDSALPGRPVSAFAVDKSNWRTAYAAFAGFAVTTPGDPGHVFKTTDGGQTWTDISGDTSKLPDNPVNDLVLDPSDPNTLFAGTDVGAFVTHDGGQSWQQLGSGLPTVSINSMKWDPEQGRLIVGTHGRGIWELDTGLQRPALAISTSDDGTPVGPGSTINYTVTVRNLGNADALNAVVTQPLPPHTHLDSAGNGGVVQGNNVVWHVGTIPAGGKVDLHYGAGITQQLASSVQAIVSDGAHVDAADSGAGSYSADGSPFETALAPAHGVKLSPKSQIDGGRDSATVTYPVTVTNAGFQSDSYTLSTDQHWHTSVRDASCTSVTTDTGPIAPGASQTVCVAVDIPADALDGETDDQVLTAVSDADPTVQDTAKVTAVAITKHVLLVDQDGNAPDVQGTYRAALTAAGIDFSVWDLSEHDSLPANLLNAYSEVYWFTGTSYPAPLTKFEPVLTDYLDRGNGLFVSGLDLLDQAGGTTDFVHDYLHVDWDGSEAQNDKPTDAIHGINGTVIGDGFGAVPLNLGPGYGPYADEITPIGPAVAQFNDDAALPDALAVTDASATTSNDYRVVFMAFPFEAFGGAADRATAVGKIQSYLSP